MTGNSSEIKKLKAIQAKKTVLIKEYKQKMRKHIFRFSIIIAVSSFIFLEYAYAVFGSTVIFLITILSLLIISIIIYYLITKYKTRQREKEIKVIRTKLYRLMRLENE